MPFKFAERKRRNKEKGNGEEVGSFGVEDSERAQPQISSTALSETERRELELSLPVDAGKEAL